MGQTAGDDDTGQWGAASWPAFPPGAELTIVKLSPGGECVTTYPGWVIEAGAPAPWLAIRAEWTRGLVQLDGLRFVPGDRLHEFFSPAHPFNLFSVWSPGGALRGWYANVTHPTRLDSGTSPPSLLWHDLYIDVIGLPDGAVAVRDEDELAAAGVAERDPVLFATITAARDELLRRLAARAFPFHEQ